MLMHQPARFLKVMTEITAEAIKDYLPDEYKKISITAYKTVDSTNRAAKEMASEGHALPLLVTADCQTAGRGRLGRSFYSPASTGIYMSLTVGGFSTPQNALFITSVAAVAVVDAIISLTGKTPGIKWVNDIYLEGRKICGILAEAQTLKNEVAVTVGIGINVTTSEFPQELTDVAGALNTDIPREKLIARITKNLLRMCENPGDITIAERYRKHSVLLGKEINYYFNGETKTAIAKDIDQSFGLVVQSEDGSYSTLSSGEVTVRLK